MAHLRTPTISYSNMCGMHLETAGFFSVSSQLSSEGGKGGWGWVCENGAKITMGQGGLDACPRKIHLIPLSSRNLDLHVTKRHMCNN